MTRFISMRLLLFLFFVVCACTPKENAPLMQQVFSNAMAKTKFTLVPEGTITIPLDSNSLNYSYYPVYYSDDTVEYYIVGNELINSIDFYDLKKQKLVRRNVYSNTVPEGVFSTLKIFIKSLDSIYIDHDSYLFPNGIRKLALTNFKGEVLHQYDVPKLPGESWMSYWISPFTVKGDQATFAYMRHGDSRYQVGQHTNVEYNLTTSEAKFTGPRYPSVFTPYIYENFHPQQCQGHDGLLITRYGALPDLFVYDRTTDTTRVIPMRSASQIADIVPDKDAQEASETDNDFEELQQGSYSGVYYDRYAHVYYSTFRQGIDIHDAKGNKNSYEDKPITIMIMNENFEYCGEVQLKSNTYHPIFLSTRDGLLISTGNAKNPLNDEDVLHFDIFKLKKL